MFLNIIRNIFVSRTQNLCPPQILRARANGETFVSATMCPRLPVPLRYWSKVLESNERFILKSDNLSSPKHSVNITNGFDSESVSKKLWKHSRLLRHLRLLFP